MDTRRPHSILPEHEIPTRSEQERARWIPLTDDEARELQGMTEDQRHAWIKANVPTKDRLARHLHAIGLPVLAARARSGEFSDFESEHATPQIMLVGELRAAHVKASRRKGEHSDKALAIRDLEKLVIAGEYDDTKAESDAWAAKQTGEIKRIIDAMTPKEEPEGDQHGT